MTQPRMVIIAGPPGAGKSSIFSLSLADNVFNADDRAAELNAGSYALETTLRSTISFEQAKLAKEKGFQVFMRYVALDTVEHHIERVKRRAARGGHSASETTLRRIHASTLANLPIALNPEESGIEIVRVYDNSQPESRPVLVLAARRGRIAWLRDVFPEWLRRALSWTPQDLESRRRDLTPNR